MKNRWMWNPNNERILDMKYRKSYSRKDFKDIFIILAKTDMRKEALRKMASKSEKGRQQCTEKPWEEYYHNAAHEILNQKGYVRKLEEEVRKLKIKNDELELAIAFTNEQKDNIIKMIKRGKNKEDIIQLCKKYHLWG